MYVILGTKVTGSIFIRWNMAFLKRRNLVSKKIKKNKRTKRNVKINRQKN